MTRSASAIARVAPRRGLAPARGRGWGAVAVLLVLAPLAGCRREPAAPAGAAAARPGKAPKAAATAPQAPGAVQQTSAPVSRPGPPPLGLWLPVPGLGPALDALLRSCRRPQP